LLTEGHASARLVDGERIALDAGELIFPHGDSHIIENAPTTKTVDLTKELARIVAQGLKLSRLGGGGEVLSPAGSKGCLRKALSLALRLERFKYRPLPRTLKSTQTV